MSTTKDKILEIINYNYEVGYGQDGEAGYFNKTEASAELEKLILSEKIDLLNTIIVGMRGKFTNKQGVVENEISELTEQLNQLTTPHH